MTKGNPGNDMTKRVAENVNTGPYNNISYFVFSLSPIPIYLLLLKFALMVMEYNGAHITSHSIPTTAYLHFVPTSSGI